MYDPYYHYRSFLSIKPDAESRSVLRDINRNFKKYSRNFNFIPLEQLHITLQFLGNSVSGQSLSIIEQMIKPIVENHEPITIVLDKLNFGFHSQNIAKHLFFSIEENQQLNHLVKEIHENIKLSPIIDINKKKDHSKLINHLTIARVKGNSNRSFSREINDFIDRSNFQPISYEAKEIQIIASKFKDNATIYTELISLRLKQNAIK